MSAALAASPGTTSAASPRSAATSRSGCGRRPVSTTGVPPAASRLATAAPMPVPAPVITAAGRAWLVRSPRSSGLPGDGGRSRSLRPGSPRRSRPRTTMCQRRGSEAVRWHIVAFGGGASRGLAGAGGPLMSCAGGGGGRRETQMADQVPATGLQLRTLVTDAQTVELSLAEAEVPAPGPDQVIIRVEAAPINPSDLGLLLAGADVTQAAYGGTPDRPVVTAPLPPGAVRAAAARVGQSLPAGNEGAGTVVAAGSSAAAQALLGKLVAVAGGGMYAQYRQADALSLPGAAGRDPGRGRGLGVRQPADRAGHGGDDAGRGAHRAGAHRGRVEPGPDAQPAVPGRRHPAGLHRPLGRPGGPAARGRRQRGCATRPRRTS